MALSPRRRPPHTDAAHRAITLELIRLCLPHHPSTDRRELNLGSAIREGMLYAAFVKKAQARHG